MLLVNGLRPYLEISDHKSEGSSDEPESLSNVSSVRGVQGEPESS